VIDRLDAGLPARSDREAATRTPYERLFTWIRELEDISPPPGWEERAAAARRAWGRRRQRFAGLVVLAIAGAAAAIVALVW